MSRRPGHPPAPLTLSRRELLRLGGAVTAGALVGAPLLGAALPACSSVPSDPGPRPLLPLASGARFPDGVVAGSPTASGIRLAVRIDELQGAKRLKLEVAADEAFGDVLHERILELSAAETGLPVAIDVDRPELRPATRYFYRLVGQGVTSPVGSFRTARPADDASTVRLAAFSCQGWQAGYFTSHAGLAAEPDLELALCLGDYIYELTDDTGPDDRQDEVGVSPGFAETLEEYRDKYRLYRSDPDLAAMHAAHAFLALWDNHELASDAPGHLGKIVPRVPLAERRQNGIQAFWDFQPMARGSDQQPLHRSLRLGGLVELFLLDLHSFNDPPASGGTYLGQAQRDWLFDGLASSKARWKLIATPTVMMSTDSSPGQPLNLDQWEGFAGERRALVEHLLARKVGGVVALSGDAHTFLAAPVTTTGRDDGTAGLVEFCGGAISSLGPVNLRPGQEALATTLQKSFLSANPHLQFIDILSRGYAVIEASDAELQVIFRSPETVYERKSPMRDLARFRVRPDRPAIEQL